MNLETYQKKIEALLNKAGKGKKVEKYLSERLQIGDNYLIYVKGNYKSVIAGLKASQSFTFDKEWESMRARKVSTFLFNPGNVLVNASEIKLNYFIRENGYSTCFPRYFQYNPLGADTRTVIFYEGEKKA